MLTCNEPVTSPAARSRAAARAVGRLFRPGEAYRKAGVLLPDLIPADQGPPDLCAAPADETRTRRRMAVLDAINRRYGRETLRFAGQLVGSGWQRRADRGSGVSTTKWAGLPGVRAG